MRNLLLFLGLFSLLFSFTSFEENTSTKPEIIKFDTEYCNMDYLFCLEYPGEILFEEKILEEGSGIKLFSKNNDITVTVAGSRNVKGRDSWDLYNDLIETNPELKCDVNFIYEIIMPDFYKSSYTKNGNQIYQELLHRGDKYITYKIVVPADKKNVLSKLKERIYLNFGIKY